MHLHVDNKNVVFFLVHNFTENIFQQLLSIENKIVVIFYIGDYFNYNSLDEILCQSKNYFLEKNKFKAHYIILSVHDIDQSIKEEYKDFFSLIVEPDLYFYFVKIFQSSRVKHSIKTKHFLSLNGRADFFRQSLYYFFIKFSLLDKSYFTYIGDTSRSTLNVDQINEIIKDKSPWYAKNLSYDKILGTIPYTIENHDHREHYKNNEEFLYQDTFLSIQLETYAIEKYPYFTEKTFRIISNRHPFIIHGAKNSLEFLKDMGFKTFNNWWDESYDSLSDHYRLEAIFYLALEIANWPLDKINKIYSDMISTLEYNSYHFLNNLQVRLGKSLPVIYEQISDIARDHEALIK